MDVLCGGPCGRRVKKGQPLFVIELPALSKGRQFRRCQRCAGEPVPEHLPPLVERVPIPQTMPVRFRPGMLAGLDFKAAAAGRDRDPGEEG